MFAELKKTFRLSVPITIGLVGQGLFALADSVMIGRILGQLSLSGATLGINITLVPLIFGFGICVAIPILTAHARGLGRADDSKSVLRHGTLLATAFALVAAVATTLFLVFGGLESLGQPENVVEESKEFTYILAWAIVPALIFQALKNYLDATGRPWLSLFWMSVGLVLNIFLNWIFMTGALGAPNLGLAGAALGTLLSRFATLVGMAIFCDEIRFRWLGKIDWQRVRESLSIGFPTAMQFFFEAAVFLGAPFCMGWINEKSIAANQVAMNISSLAFMVPLGISQASSIRAGEAFGRGEWARLRLIGKGALGLAVSFMAVYAMTLTIFREKIPLLYGLNPEAVEIAKDFLVVAGAYAIFDGIQNVSAGLLRGLGDAKIVMWASLLCYWLISAPVALILAFPCGLDGLGIWIGLAIGLAFAAVVLGTRLRRNLQRERVFPGKIFA